VSITIIFGIFSNQSMRHGHAMVSFPTSLF